MATLIIGVLAATVLGVAYGLLNRRAATRPREFCGGCALANVCANRHAAPGEGGAGTFDDREACYASHARQESRPSR